MSAQVLRCSAARRSLCSSCLPSRRASAYYSQSFAGRIQDLEASVSVRRGAKSLSGIRDNPGHHAVTGARGPLDSTRLDRYLAPLKAADLEPTLDDIEQCKPESSSRPDSSRYATEYTNLLETLCRSFSKDQLRRFTELYKLDPIWTRSSRRKTEYAETIIEKVWGWPSLKEIERKRRDTTEVLIKSFPVTPSQLFLIMGRDGADLLQLSRRYNVHISLTSNPLALRVEGLRGSLKGLTEYISFLKKGIVDEIFELPSGRPVRPDLLQHISRLAGAYIENHGHRGKVRICAKDLGDVIAAKQFALRASLEVGTQAHTICFDPPDGIRNSPVKISEPHRYSIYPFVSPSPLPWTMHSGGVFRMRRVADWLGVDSYEDIASTGGLARNPHRLLNLDRSQVELSQLVSPATSASTLYSQRVVTASLGHILISSGDNSQRAAIYPPLRGALSLPDILKWVETSSTPLTFVPSVPPAITTGNIAGQASKLPQNVLKFEMVLPALFPTSTQSTQNLENALETATLSLDEWSSSMGHVSLRGCVSQSCNSPEAFAEERDLSCQVGREIYVNLMLPDRPMDVQVCIFEWDGVTSMQQPQVVRQYAEKFLANTACPSQPDPPSTFSYAGRIYYLHDSLSLRQVNARPDLLSLTPGNSNVDNSVAVSSESIVDLQSTQKTELCQVRFNGTTDGPAWGHFLAACDRLSVMSLQSRSKDKS